MMEMKEQTGSRKKLLVPVVVLMLCLVTLTGAAYAYSSSMTYTNNTVQEDFISIDLATPNYEQDVHFDTNSAIAFTDDIVYDANNAKTVAVYANVTDTKIVYDLKIQGDVVCNVVKVTSANLESFLGVPIGTKTLTNLIQIKVGTAADGTGAQALTTNASEATLTVAKTADKTEDYSFHVYVFINKVASTVTIQEPKAPGTTGFVTAEDCYNALGNNANAKFSLKFEAVVA